MPGRKAPGAFALFGSNGGAPPWPAPGSGGLAPVWLRRPVRLPSPPCEIPFLGGMAP